MNFWLVKSEPNEYAWADLVKDKKTVWTGVRNFAARNHLRAMAKGDPVLFYHSVEEKQVVGLAQVSKTAFPDPTATEGDWSAVELKPLKALPKPVTLAWMKTIPALANIPLIRIGRLSVMPLTPEEYQILTQAGGLNA
jgi:predicted RNA-binding protein with PUA-like domain